MTHSRDRNRREARGAVQRDLRPRLLVVCEGERTEREYLRGLERHVRCARVVVLAPERGEPRKIVEIAKSEWEAAEPGDYDAAWCVFDRDDHERFADAVAMARANRFEVAVSNPCFELWLLLHHRDSPGLQHRDQIGKLLRKLVPGSGKGVKFADYADQVDEAIRRARKLEEDAAAMGEHGRNPTTGVWRLIEAIRGESPPPAGPPGRSDRSRRGRPPR